MSTTELKSLDFVAHRCLMKVFKMTNIEIIFIHVRVTECHIRERTRRFGIKYEKHVSQFLNGLLTVVIMYAPSLFLMPCLQSLQGATNEWKFFL